jgi:ABC-type multidrug transport system permease subunit
MAAGLANSDVICAANEYVRFDPAAGQNCFDYTAAYRSTFGGYVNNPTALNSCEFCAVSSTNTFLASVEAFYGDRWRNFGIMWVFASNNRIMLRL